MISEWEVLGQTRSVRRLPFLFFAARKIVISFFKIIGFDKYLP